MPQNVLRGSPACQLSDYFTMRHI